MNSIVLTPALQSFHAAGFAPSVTFFFVFVYLFPGFFCCLSSFFFLFFPSTFLVMPLSPRPPCPFPLLLLRLLAVLGLCCPLYTRCAYVLFGFENRNRARRGKRLRRQLSAAINFVRFREEKEGMHQEWLARKKSVAAASKASKV